MLKNNYEQKIKEFNFIIDLYMFTSLVLLCVSFAYQSLDWVLYNIEPNLLLRYPMLNFGGILLFFMSIAILATRNSVKLKELENINLLDKNMNYIHDNRLKIESIINLMNEKEYAKFVKEYDEFKQSYPETTVIKEYV